MEKQRYKIRNLQSYNEALVNRGSLTFWFDEDVIAAVHDVENIHRGHPFVYSDVAILCGLSLKVIFSRSQPSVGNAFMQRSALRDAECP
jgi:hypothetical protein